MEFETNIPTPDEQARLNASARQITIQPISTTVIPEPAEGSDINARLSETAHTANPANDSEDTAIQLERTMQQHASEQGSTHPPKRALLASIACASFFVAAFLWVLTQ